MEPDLITQRTIEKIIKKNYFAKESVLNKFKTNIVHNQYINKVNWPIVFVTLFILIILAFLYRENKIKKDRKAEQMKADEEMEIINSKSEKFKNDDFKSKANYESEYYKMLPRVTNNPEIQDYKY